MTTKEELARLDDTGIACWDRHDADAFLALFADDFEWVDDTRPMPMRSREEALRYTRSWFTAFPDMRMKETNRVIGDDSIASEVEFTGTNQGPLYVGDQQIPATGRKMSTHAMVFIRTENGKIKQFHTHPDSLGMMAQLGMVDGPPRDETGMTAEDLIRLDEQQNEAFNRKDADGFLAGLADDFVWIDDAMPEPIRDLDAARAYVQGFWTAFPDLELRVTNRIVGDDAVAGELEFHGTHTGELDLGGGNRMPPTGRECTFRGSFFFKARDGEITEFHTYTDSLGMMSQLGVIGAPS